MCPCLGRALRQGAVHGFEPAAGSDQHCACERHQEPTEVLGLGQPGAVLTQSLRREAVTAVEDAAHTERAQPLKTVPGFDLGHRGLELHDTTAWRCDSDLESLTDNQLS